MRRARTNNARLKPIMGLSPCFPTTGKFLWSGHGRKRYRGRMFPPPVPCHRSLAGERPPTTGELIPRQQPLSRREATFKGGKYARAAVEILKSELKITRHPGRASRPSSLRP